MTTAISIRLSAKKFALYGLALLSAALASTSGHSTELQSAYGNSNCIFAPDTQFAAGSHPFSVAAGDLNGDGRADIAVANEGSNNVSILLATGAGNFAAATEFAVGAAPRSVVIADVSGDGKLDLAVANSGDGTLTIRFGTGTGTFGSPSTLAVGSGPRSLAVADLNSDGKRDLVVANSSNSASVLLGTGGGAFAAAVNHAVAGNPISVAIADFNADGKPDLAVASESNTTVSTLLGNGTGGFGAANPIPLGSQPRAVVSGDLNADGKPDLAIANAGPDTVSILLGSGGGAFDAPTQYPAHALGTALAVADMDADGKSELVVANEIPWPTIVTVLRGLDGGTFAAPTWIQHLGGAIPRGVAAGDFNADGIPDLVLANHASDNVSILLGDCAPTMNIAPNPDVDLTSSYELRKSPVWFDRQAYSPLTTFTHAVAHADVDRDGRTDLLRASIESQLRVPLQVLMQTAGGGFVDRTNEVLDPPGPGMVWARKALRGDYNEDGWPDALFLDHGDDYNVTTGQFNQLFLSNGDGTLRYSPLLEGWLGFHHGGASADIDGNGTVDVMAMNAGGGGENLAYFLINDGLGNFTRSINRLPMELQEQSNYTFELIDVDGDGFIDLLTAGGESTEGQTPATIYWGSSTGLYRSPGKTVFPLPVGYGTVLDFAAEDIDGDGDKDAIIHRTTNGYLGGRYFQILRQVAPRQFVDETASRISIDTSTTTAAFDSFRVQDINGDSYLDIFVDDKGLVSKGEYAWTNNGQGVFAPYFGPVNPAFATTTIEVADMALAEGNTGTRQLDFVVRLNRPATAPVSFNIGTGSGTAVAGSDFVAKTSNGVVIGVGQASAMFSVLLNGDLAAEDDEAFTVTLSAVTGAKVLRGRAYGYIDNDDVYQLSVADVSTSEGHAGSSQASFTVALSSASPEPVSFDIFTAPGTASPGLDYASAAQIGKTIAAGQTSTSFQVSINGDAAVEGHETFTVNIVNPSGAVIADGQALGRIVNDDLAQLSVADASVLEGNAGQVTLTFLVRLSWPMPNPVTFDIATSNGTATAGSDYVARSLSGRLMDAGRTQWRFEVAVNGDTLVEPDETFTVTLSNVVGAALGDGSGAGVIVTDEPVALRKNRALHSRKPRPGVLLEAP